MTTETFRTSSAPQTKETELTTETTTAQQTTTTFEDALQTLRGELTGEALTSSNEGYDTARKLHCTGRASLPRRTGCAVRAVHR